MYTLQGKTRPTHRTLPTIGPRMVLDHMYLTWSTYSNLSRSRQQSWAGPLLPRKSALDPIHSTTVDRSIGPYLVSLPSKPMKQWGQSQPTVDGWLLGLPGPYLRNAIGTFNTCSRELTHRSLTDTSGGYNLGGASFPHHTPRPSQPTVSAFYLRALPELQFNHSTIPLN
jgi:hypothetical protein